MSCGALLVRSWRKVYKLSCLTGGTPAGNVKLTQVCGATAGSKLFQQHWRHLKGNHGLNSAFEKADRLLEQKHTGGQFH